MGAALSAPALCEARPAEQFFPSVTDVFVPASKLPREGLQSRYQHLHRKAERTGSEPGRNILFEGVNAGRGRVRAATRRELRRSNAVLERMTGAASAEGSAPGSSGAASPALEAIAACESGGDPTAVGGGGLYRGKYQFTYETWQSVGGSGDPAAAPEAEQDARAATLLARGGAGQWPVCGG